MAPVIEEMIDRHPIGRLQRLIVGFLALVMFLDGLDLQLLAYAAPVITNEWNITRLQLAPALSATLIGTALGALIGGAIGDRLGRRWSLIGSVALFGAATILCSFSGDVVQLALCRFVSGLGFGACFPSVVALTAEWMPKRTLTKVTGFIQVGVPAGAMVGALLSGSIIPALGWRASFVVGGLFPLILAVAMIVLLPESAMWLARTSGHVGRVRDVLQRAWPDVPMPDERQGQANGSMAPASPKGGYKQVLSDISIRTNVGVWLGFLANGLAAYAFWSWGTTVLTATGLGLEEALRGAFFYALAGLIATYPAAYLASKFGTRLVMLVLSIGGGAVLISLYGLVSVVPTGQGSSIRTLLFAGFFLAGSCLSGLQGLLYVIAAQGYPTVCRASGVGLGSTIGRIGGILSAFAGGALLSLLPVATFFLATAVTILGVALAAIIFDRHRRDDETAGDTIVAAGQPLRPAER